MDKPKFIIVGYGRMGRLVKQVLDERKEKIVGRVDPVGNVLDLHPLYASIKDVVLKEGE